jgi:hypothetical protein
LIVILVQDREKLINRDLAYTDTLVRPGLPGVLQVFRKVATPALLELGSPWLLSLEIKGTTELNAQAVVRTGGSDAGSLQPFEPVFMLLFESCTPLRI